MAEGTDYTVCTPLELKVSDIKDNINEYVQTCLANSNQKELKSSLMNRLQIRLAEIYRQERTMTTAEVFALSADDIHSLYLAYLHIITYINTIVSYMPTKAEFLAFARINANDYAKLLDTDNDSVKQECTDIDNDFINLTLSAAEKGEIKEHSGKIRLKAKGGIGHSLIEVGDTESVLDKINDSMTEKQLRYEFENILNAKKQIDKQ